ncbi:protein lin-37 homolog [Coturnix japonica]|uniref:protein lin-37 homolog n=1 Tax=Coturnix japonica TaxID=93934 RepID=UPI0013A5EFE3|nr:protein lin-37 homolog [Coturnix japonica]
MSRPLNADSGADWLSAGRTGQATNERARRRAEEAAREAGDAAGGRSHPPHAAMLSLKVKVEKPDLEATSARSRLDAVLQGLLERNEGDREALEDDAGKAGGDSIPKAASPSATGKRSSRRFPPHRRKKRREAEEGQPEPPLHRHNTYVIKLFDRSVELGQFSEGTPLYPVCRAWMRNCPTARPTTCPTAPDPAPQVEPKSPFLAQISPFWPQFSPVQPLEPPSMSTLIYSNMERWKRVRQRWKEASARQQQRYGASLRLLRRIYERQ